MTTGVEARKAIVLLTKELAYHVERVQQINASIRARTDDLRRRPEKRTRAKRVFRAMTAETAASVLHDLATTDMSQLAIANKHGTTQTHVSNLLNGRRT